MTLAAAGSLGGKATASRHDHEFYQTIGRKGGRQMAGIIRDCAHRQCNPREKALVEQLHAHGIPLTKYEERICSMRAAGHTFAEIGEHFKVSRQCIHQQYTKIRARVSHATAKAVTPPEGTTDVGPVSEQSAQGTSPTSSTRMRKSGG
jgi:DNA-binding CsgD family transcriptional regulator